MRVKTVQEAAPPPPPDNELVARIQADPEALEAQHAIGILFERHIDRLTGRIMRKSSMPFETAEEVAQDTMVKAWRNIEKFDPEIAPFDKWLNMIALSATIDESRRPKRLVSVDPHK